MRDCTMEPPITPAIMSGLVDMVVQSISLYELPNIYVEVLNDLSPTQVSNL